MVAQELRHAEIVSYAPTEMPNYLIYAMFTTAFKTINCKPFKNLSYSR